MLIEIVKNMMHCYSCMPVFPESRKSYNEILKLFVIFPAASALAVWICTLLVGK